jgi:hypothetical protein
MLLRGNSVRADQTQRDVARLVGAALVLAGVPARSTMRRLMHVRARIAEQRSAVWLKLDDPGIVLGLIGVALLRASARAHPSGVSSARGTPTTTTGDVSRTLAG